MQVRHTMGENTDALATVVRHIGSIGWRS